MHNAILWCGACASPVATRLVLAHVRAFDVDCTDVYVRVRTVGLRSKHATDYVITSTTPRARTGMVPISFVGSCTKRSPFTTPKGVKRIDDSLYMHVLL